MAAKVTSKKHQYNSKIRCIFIGDRLWAIVPAKECAKELKSLRTQLALDPYYAERRGY